MLHRFLTATMPSFSHSTARGRAARILALAGLVLPGTALAQTQTVDFRYAPPYWYSALGLPDDGHKPLASETGALLYDFGPGPYVIPLTRVGVGVRGVALERQSQTTDAPRVPLVRTRLAGQGVRLDLLTYATVPEGGAARSSGSFGTYERLDGIVGALGWASPNLPSDSAFRNVAWGITRPIRYRLRVAPSARKRVVLGFAESYKPRLNERVAWMKVEGAPDQTADLALTARRNDPQVFLFAAHDANADGWLDVEVLAPQGHDPNTTLAAVWMYPEQAGFTREHLLAGRGGTPPELRIDAGTELQRQPARVDAIEATVDGPANAVPVVTVETRRGLAVRDGVLWMGETPFVATEPAFVSADSTDTGWTLALPPGTRTARVLVFAGTATEADLRRARAARPDADRARLAAFWQSADVPFGKIRVPDAAVQALLDQSLRTLYQGRETVDGQGQFQSGFSLYRGLWTGDAAYHIDLAYLLGDRARAQETLEAVLAHQTESGLFEVMRPFTFWRESAQAVWMFARFARLAEHDPAGRAYAASKWDDVLRGVEALRRARQSTVGTGAPYDGLFPPAFSDGGIGEIGAEYSSVLWTTIALRELARVAPAYGRTADVAALDAFQRDLRTSFDAAFARDARTDAHGHRYLPVPVGKTGPDEVPTLAQWAALEAHLFTDAFPLGGAYQRGTLGIMDDATRQGLPISTGWLRDGIWAGFGFLVGTNELLVGNDERAADILYAIANHASPVGTWVEEQPLVGAGNRLAGDMPHTWHPTVFVRYAANLLALDRGDDLHLLGAVPAAWLRPGATSALDDLQTVFGPLTLALDVSRDGRTATLRLNAVGRDGQPGRILVHTASLARAGFRLASGGRADDSGTVALPWGGAATLTFRKPR